MKILSLIIAAILSAYLASAQDVQRKDNGYSFGAQYIQEFVLDGYVHVREWELEGDKMTLKDLGMTSYPALQVSVQKHLIKNRSITIAYEQYFMRGSATFDRDIAYNGTLINGRNGIDISPTRYYRLSANFQGNLLVVPTFSMQFIAGLVYDRVTFYLDGEVSQSSPRNEVYEGFGKQALPYPVAGVIMRKNLGRGNKIYAETSGTYIPEFKSFFKEGGSMRLQYSTLQGDLHYTRCISHLEISVGAKFRHMHLFQESDEDTNDLWTLTIGPFVGIRYHFQ